MLTDHCVPWLVIWSSSLIQEDKYIHNHCRAAWNWGINKHYSISEATKLYFKQTTENPHGTGTPGTVSIPAAAASYPCLTAYSPMKCVGQMCHIYSHTAPWLCLHKVCFYFIAHKKKSWGRTTFQLAAGASAAPDKDLALQWDCFPLPRTHTHTPPSKTICRQKWLKHTAAALPSFNKGHITPSAWNGMFRSVTMMRAIMFIMH